MLNCCNLIKILFSELFKTMTKRRDLEHYIQAEFISLMRYYTEDYPLLGLIYAIPNGGKRGKVEGMKLKTEGVLAGIPDTCLPIPNGTYGALYLEFKTEKGKLSDKQKEVIPLLEQAYNKVVVVRTAKDAIEEVGKYLELDLPYFDLKRGYK